MWIVQTRSGHRIHAWAVAILLAVMVGVWPDIPPRWQLSSLAAAVVIIGLPLAYVAVDVLADGLDVALRARAEAEGQAAEAPIDDRRSDPLPRPIQVNDGPASYTIPRVSALEEAIALLNRAVALKGRYGVLLPGHRDMGADWPYSRWSAAVRSLAPYLVPKAGGLDGGGTAVFEFAHLGDLLEAVTSGRVRPHGGQGEIAGER